MATGGVLSGISPVLPFACSGIALLAAIPALLALPEQRPLTHARPRPLAHLRAGLRAAWRNPVLLGLVLLSGLTAGIVTTVGYYTQLYIHALGFSIAAVGLIFACSIGPDALFAASAPRIMRRLPRRWVLGIFVGAEALGLLALATQAPMLALLGFQVLFHAGDAVLFPAISTYLNERSPEAQRATVLSLDTGLFSLVMIVLFPLFGFGLTHIAYGTAYLWTFAPQAVGCLGILGFVGGDGEAERMDVEPLIRVLPVQLSFDNLADRLEWSRGPTERSLHAIPWRPAGGCARTPARPPAASTGIPGRRAPMRLYPTCLR